MGVIKNIADPETRHTRPNLIESTWINPSKSYKEGSILDFFGPKETAIVISVNESYEDVVERAYDSIRKETGSLYIENRSFESLDNYLSKGNSGEFYACSEKNENTLRRLCLYISVCENLSEIKFLSARKEKAKWLSSMPYEPELDNIKKALPKMFTEFDTILIGSYNPKQRIVSVKLSGLNDGCENLVEKASEKFINSMKEYGGAPLHDNAFFFTAALYRFGFLFGRPNSITKNISERFFEG